MAANTGKDGPPAYTSQDYQAVTTGVSAGSSAAPELYPNHSTLASEFRHAFKNNECPESQYLEATFSVIFRCHGKLEPVVLAINEEYKTLLDDLQNMFGDPYLARMNVVWGKDWMDFSFNDSEVKRSSITAWLRLLKSRNGKDYIVIR